MNHFLRVISVIEMYLYGRCIYIYIHTYKYIYKYLFLFNLLFFFILYTFSDLFDINLG